MNGLIQEIFAESERRFEIWAINSSENGTSAGTERADSQDGGKR